MLSLLMRLASHPLYLSRQVPRPVPIAAAGNQHMHLSQNKFKRPRYAATDPAASGSSSPKTAAEGHQEQQQAAAATAAPAARPKVIIITGPTAVGKTKLGLDLAKRIGGEIISADSVQVYRGLDVGSDKLPVDQREGIPHHLIDILDPSEEFSAGDFHSLGRKAAEDIIARGKVPIVAGGTGLYLRWFVHGKPTTPPSSPQAAAKALELIGQAWVTAAAEVAAAQRDCQQQQEQQQQQGQVAASEGDAVEQPLSAAGATVGVAADAAVAPSSATQNQPAAVDAPQTDPAAAAAAAAVKQMDLSRLGPVSPAAAQAAAQLQDQQRWDVAVDVVQQLGDPETAARIRAERNNWYRLQRVLQILILNGGKPLSQLDIDTTKDLDYDFRCFFLHRPRLELFDRIIYRVEEMVAGGLLSEALMLLDRGMQPNTNIATRAIGYRQALDFMKAALAKGSASEQELQQLIFDIATASRNLVKNQTTWFRDDAMFRWLEVSGRSTDDVLQEVLTELDKPQHEGGCGDSGRFDKATQTALKRYIPKLKLYNDPEQAAAVLKWVKEAAAARKGGSAVDGDAAGTEAEAVVASGTADGDTAGTEAEAVAASGTAAGAGAVVASE